jgi:WD40 repeat protein
MVFHDRDCNLPDEEMSTMSRCSILCWPALLVLSASAGAADPVVIDCKDGWIGSVAYTADGRFLAIGTSRGRIHGYSEGAIHPPIKQQHEDALSAFAFSPRGELDDYPVLAAGSHDGMVGVYGRGVGKDGYLTVKSAHKGAIMSIAWQPKKTPNGIAFFSGGMDGMIRLWSAKDMKLKKEIKAHTSWVNGLAVSADGSFLVSGSSDNTVRLWNLDEMKEQARWTVKEGEVRSVAVSPDGKRIAAGIRYGHVKVWDIESKKELAAMKAHSGETWAVAFTPDGKTLCSGGGDWNQPGEVRLWDTTTWKETKTLKHTNEVLCLAVSPDGKRLAAGGWDGKVLVWELKRP